MPDLKTLFLAAIFIIFFLNAVRHIGKSYWSILLIFNSTPEYIKVPCPKY